jgi:hypothetical protein
VRDAERDRDAPRRTIREAQILDDVLPVGVPVKAGQWRVHAGRDQFEVGVVALIDLEFRQAGKLTRVRIGDSVDERAAVRRVQGWHVGLLGNSRDR